LVTSGIINTSNFSLDIITTMAQQRLFLTGASGYIGSTVAEYAIAQGYTVRGLSRTESSDQKIRKFGATPVRGDLSTHDVLTREASEADIVINIADAMAGNFAMKPEERVRINNAALDALARGLKGSGKGLVCTSGTLFVAADPEGKETDESSPAAVDTPWGTGQESHSVSLKDQGIRVTVARLAPYVYGRGGSGVMLYMRMFAKSGECFYVGGGKARTTAVHVEDAAKLYLLMAQKGKAGEIYNVTAENDITQRQLVEAIAETVDIPVRSQSFEETKDKTGNFLAHFMCAENIASNAKAWKDFSWKPEAEKGILDEIRSGSYVKIADDLRKSAI
jgi:nucleoside-diphosphate-sugar epimerase